MTTSDPFRLLAAWLEPGTAHAEAGDRTDEVPLAPAAGPSRSRLSLPEGLAEGEQQRGRISPVVLAAAALPWLIVLALVVGGGAEATTAERAAVAPSAGLEAIALVALQQAGNLVDAPAPLRLDGVEIERVQEHAGFAVVTVAALLTDSGGRQHAVRVALPVHGDGEHPALAGAPWLLPLRPVAGPGWEPVIDAATAGAAAAAVTAAGYQHVMELAISRSPRLPEVLQASFTATGPGQAGAARHVVWLDGRPPHALLGTGPAGAVGSAATTTAPEGRSR